MLSEDLQDYQAKGQIEKFSLTATQAILYFNSIGAKDYCGVTLSPPREVSRFGRVLSSRAFTSIISRN